MSLPEHININFHTHENNHYLEVDSECIRSLNMNVSQFSFVSPDHQKYYLESETDGENFILLLSDHGISFKLIEIAHDSFAYFYAYQRVKPSLQHH